MQMFKLQKFFNGEFFLGIFARQLHARLDLLPNALVRVE